MHFFNFNACLTPWILSNIPALDGGPPAKPSTKGWRAGRVARGTQIMSKPTTKPMTEKKKLTKRAAAAAAAAAAIPVDLERVAMEKLYADTMKNLTEGSVIPGKILEICGEDVVVDIGSKSEGIIPLVEFKEIADLKPGDVHDVLIESMDDETGTIKLSYQRAKEQQRWNRVVANCKEGSVVKGMVQGRVRGGLLVDVDGIEAFLPGSQVDIVPVQNPDDYLNREFEFKIIKINTDRKNIVISRRELLEDQRRGRKRELLTDLKVGQLRPGVVKNITDFGVFVDLDGMDGLLHITDMSWGRLNHPSELVKVGEPIDVMVLDVNLEKERVSLG
ncbi:MAG: 30S ribosomal protein S1, partial [Kiritimatiellia bacterium]